MGQGGLFSVNSPLTIVKAAAGFAVMVWYCNQFRALGEDRAADTEMGIWMALGRLPRQEKCWLKARARAIASTLQSA